MKPKKKKKKAHYYRSSTEEQGLYEVEDDSDMHQGGGRGRQVWTDADLADRGVELL